MDLQESAARFNVIDLIREIRQSPTDLGCSSPKQCFPYVQTFYTPKNKEKSVFSYSNRLGVNFIHDDTLRFKKPSFSVNRMFKSSDNPTRELTPLISKSTRRPFNAKKTFLTTFNRLDSPQVDKETTFKNFLIHKVQPRLHKPPNKSGRIKPIIMIHHERLSPDILKINKIYHSAPSPLKFEDKLLSRNNISQGKQRRLVIELEGVVRLDESLASFENQGLGPSNNKL